MERYYKIHTNIDDIKPPYELAKVLSNGEFVSELNAEIGVPDGDEMNLEQVHEYIRLNHVEDGEID